MLSTLPFSATDEPEKAASFLLSCLEELWREDEAAAAEALLQATAGTILGYLLIPPTPHAWLIDLYMWSHLIRPF